MTEDSFESLARSEADGAFELHGRPGTVSVTYGINTDPEQWGYDVLSLPYETGVARGFPVLEASVSYTGHGYLAFMGWIQIVRYTYEDDPLVVLVDRPPALLDVDTPFLAAGPSPPFSTPRPRPGPMPTGGPTTSSWPVLMP